MLTIISNLLIFDRSSMFTVLSVLRRTYFTIMAAPAEKRNANVEPAVESDIPHIVEVFYNAFTGERTRSIFPDTEGGRRWVGKTFEDALGGPPRSEGEGGPGTKVLVSRSPEGIM